MSKRNEATFTDGSTSFTDEDLARVKRMSLVYREDITALLARLEAAEQVIADIVYPDHGFFDEKGWRKAHYEAWRKSAGKEGKTNGQD